MAHSSAHHTYGPTTSPPASGLAKPQARPLYGPLAIGLDIQPATPVTSHPKVRKGHCQVVGLMGAFDHAARPPLMFTPRFGRTSPAARSGRPWRGHCGTRSRSSDAAADGSGRRSWRGMTGSAGPAPAI